MSKHITPEELAKRWKMKETTLANWRSREKGLSYLKLEGKILYRLSDVIEYEKNNIKELDESKK